LRLFTTVRFPVLQFNAVKKQFVATRKVPIAEFEFAEIPARYLPLRPTWNAHRIGCVFS
jgi:hypothetical protein